jgi:hypothetical protein
MHLFFPIWTTKWWFSSVKLRVPLNFFLEKKALVLGRCVSRIYMKLLKDGDQYNTWPGTSKNEESGKQVLDIVYWSSQNDRDDCSHCLIGKSSNLLCDVLEDYVGCQDFEGT